MFYSFPLAKILGLFLIVIRFTIIIYMVPIYGEINIPKSLRVLFSVAMAMPFLSTTYVDNFSLSSYSIESILFYTGKEVGLGLCIGFLCKMIFEGFFNTANIIGYQMGFGTASLFISEFETQTNSFSAIHRMIIMLLFYTLNLHHVIIQALYKVLHILPVGKVFINTKILALNMYSINDFNNLTLMLGAPILIMLIIVTFLLGLISRAMPQMNIFSLSFPASFIIGTVIYLCCLGSMPDTVAAAIMNLTKKILLIAEFGS